MGNENGRRYITWQGFVALGIPIVVVPILVTWFLLQAHSALTHEGAATQEDLRNVSDQLREIRLELREIRKEMK